MKKSTTEIIITFLSCIIVSQILQALWGGDRDLQMIYCICSFTMMNLIQLRYGDKNVLD